MTQPTQYSCAYALLSRLEASGLFLVCKGGILRPRDSVPLEPELQAALDLAVGKHLPEATRPHYGPRRALIQLVLAPTLAARELLTYPVVHAVGLPVPFTVRFQRGPTACTSTSLRAAHEAALARREFAFVHRELAAAAGAVASGRAGPHDLDAWIDTKRRRPGWVLTVERVPGDASDPAEVCFGALFDALGAELLEVVVGDYDSAAALAPLRPERPAPPACPLGGDPDAEPALGGNRLPERNPTQSDAIRRNPTKPSRRKRVS